MKLILNSRIPKLLGADATTIYPFIFMASPVVLPILLQHEMIHVRQVRTIGWFKFYALYFGHYLLSRIQGLTHKQAYLAVPFEAEAYQNQDHTPLSAEELKELGL